jgi:hypothetical protein
MTRKLGQNSFERDAAALKTILGGWVFLRAPLTSASWDGDSFSTTAKTAIDLSAVFGAPAGIRAVNVRLAVRDSGASGAGCWFILAPNNTAAQGLGLNIQPHDDQWIQSGFTVPCDANGDVYYQCQATGANTLDVILEIWGYCI